MYGYPGRPEEGFLNPSDLELQMIVSHLTWALGSERRSSERVAYLYSHLSCEFLENLCLVNNILPNALC